MNKTSRPDLDHADVVRAVADRERHRRRVHAVAHHPHDLRAAAVAATILVTTAAGCAARAQGACARMAWSARAGFRAEALGGGGRRHAPS
jgi:hypothetical protein